MLWIAAVAVLPIALVVGRDAFVPATDGCVSPTRHETVVLSTSCAARRLAFERLCLKSETGALDAVRDVFSVATCPAGVRRPD
jgi:hypothetical protein